MARRKKKKGKRQKMSPAKRRDERDAPPRRPQDEPLSQERPHVPAIPDLPQVKFDALVLRLDALTKCWMTKWPDGINPDKLLERKMGHAVRAYKNGIRAASLYDVMEEIADSLVVPGLCDGEDL